MENNNTNNTVRGKYSFTGNIQEFKKFILNKGELEEITECDKPVCTVK
jgi:hypothetical protein